MAEKTKTKEELKDIVLDETKSRTVRKKAAEELRHRVLNPFPAETFNPETFEPRHGDLMTELIPRSRKAPPLRLPTNGMLPKEIMEGQMIGMLESKQDLYLLLAYFINQILDRLDELEK